MPATFEYLSSYMQKNDINCLLFQFIFIEDEEQNNASKGTSDFTTERPSMYNDHYLQGKNKVGSYAR